MKVLLLSKDVLQSFGSLGPVWLLFLKTILENNFWEQFLRTVFGVFLKKIVFGNWILKNSFCSQKQKNMFGWVNKKKKFRTNKTKNMFERFFFSFLINKIFSSSNFIL